MGSKISFNGISVEKGTTSETGDGMHLADVMLLYRVVTKDDYILPVAWVEIVHDRDSHVEIILDY